MIDPKSAVAAGMGAGVMMSVARLALLPIGLRPVLLMTDIWRGLLRLPSTRVAYAVHLAVSGAVGVVYAFGFRMLGLRPSLGSGLLGGVVHWLVAGVFMAVVPALDPEIPERQPRPGPFALRLGAGDAVAFLVNHLLFGVVMAKLYARGEKPGARQ